MKTAIAFTTLALLASPAWASHQDNNPDLKQGITNVHESHFPHVAGDSHEPERGRGDSYGSVLLDDHPSVANRDANRTPNLE